MKLRAVKFVSLLALLLLACAGPSPRQEAQSPSAAQPAPTQPKRVTTAINGNPTTFYPRTLVLSGGTPGVDALADLVQAGLAVREPNEALQPRLADAIPSLENGQWKLFPDGRMETTWRLRPGVRWHDGTPLTAEDLVFTLTVSRDRDLPTFRDPAFASIESYEAMDDSVILVRWNRPYIYAEDLFTRDLAAPLPRHLLATPYAEDKANFINLTYWTGDFVGSGPYRVREWVDGSHTVLEAYDQYVLGRPKIDVIEVKFIPSSNTLAANIVAGAVEVTLGRALSLELALQVQSQWKEGRMEVGRNILDRVYPQWQNPNPATLLDVRMRRALLHAIDRQEMIDTFEAGLTTVSHSFLPNEPRLEAVNARVPRYEFDPRRSAELLEEVGYTRGTDGAFQDSTGRRLSIEIMASSGNDRYEKMVPAITNFWSRVGVTSEATMIPFQRQQDWEYRMTRGGLLLLGGASLLKGLEQQHTAEMKTRQNNWVGFNFGNYSNPAMDSLLDRYLSTVPLAERTEIVSQIVYQLSDQVVLFPLYYYVDPTMIANRLINVAARGPSSSQAWNVHGWDVSS